jgi:S1-C subfamily serine protease
MGFMDRLFYLSIPAIGYAATEVKEFYDTRTKEEAIGNTMARVYSIKTVTHEPHWLTGYLIPKWCTRIHTRGTGFILRGNLMVTNYHVVQEYHESNYGNNELVIRDENMDEIDAYICKYDKDKDICAILLSNHTGSVKEMAIRETNIHLGENVIAVSMANSDEVHHVTYGHINHRFIDEDDNPMHSTNIHIPHGFSGSPLIDTDGKLIGMNTTSYSPENHMSAAIPYSDIAAVIGASDTKKIDE